MRHRARCPEKAYEPTDLPGRRVLVWWTPAWWAVAAEDRAFRRRVARARSTPLWTRHDAIGPDGIRSSYLVAGAEHEQVSTIAVDRATVG